MGARCLLLKRFESLVGVCDGLELAWNCNCGVQASGEATSGLWLTIRTYLL